MDIVHFLNNLIIIKIKKFNILEACIHFPEEPNDLSVDMRLSNGLRMRTVSYQKEEDMVMVLAVFLVFIVHAEGRVHMTQMMMLI